MPRGPNSSRRTHGARSSLDRPGAAQLNGTNAILHFLSENLAHAGFGMSKAMLHSGVDAVFSWNPRKYEGRTPPEAQRSDAAGNLTAGMTEKPG
ncbi:hypothetical protein B0H10DRAFT_2210003 [Mycena sp. CBHHK59/15]|nr:hypothetical protein B0H10DRAFT_2210003 [Mycena sp. CBHHK59/15]